MYNLTPISHGPSSPPTAWSTTGTAVKTRTVRGKTAGSTSDSMLKGLQITATSSSGLSLPGLPLRWKRLLILLLVVCS